MAAGFDRAPRYLVHERLAVGGMGEVYLGTMVSHAGRRPVAVKRVAPERLRDRDAVARLVAEARLGFRLTHANVCQVHDLVFGAEGAYVVMEYVRGLDLRALLRRSREIGRPLAPEAALYAVREVARALDYAHRLGDEDGRPLHIVHGDVTPQNILVSLEGEVKLADFGIARALGTAAPGTDVLGGTRGYMAPEIVSGAIDHRSDVYSLGATLHAALVGDPPPSPGSAPAVRATFSAELASLIERAIAREPGDRFLSAGELEAALAFELARRYPSFTPSALATAVRDARRSSESAEQGNEAATLFALASQAATFAQGAPTEVVAPWQRVDATPTAVTRSGQGTRTMTDGEAPATRARRWWPVVSAAVAAALAAVAAVLVFGGSDAGPAARAGAASPPDAGRRLAAAPAIDASAELAVAPAADPGAPVTADAAAASDEPAPELAARERRRRQRERARARRQRAAYLSVNATPWGAVEVDGRRVADETPVYKLRVAPGVHQVQVVFGDGRRSARKEVDLAPGEHETLGFR